jgi:hypothetical protein
MFLGNLFLLFYLREPSAKSNMWHPLSREPATKSERVGDKRANLGIKFMCRQMKGEIERTASNLLRLLMLHFCASICKALQWL